MKYFLKRLGRALTNPRLGILYLLSKLIKILSKDTGMNLWLFGNSDRFSLLDIAEFRSVSDLKILQPFNRTKGVSITLDELTCICGIIHAFQIKSVLEIGTFDGNTTLNIAANLPDDGSVTTVDLPLDWNGRYEIDVSKENHNVTKRPTVGIQFLNSEENKKIIQVYGDTAKLDWQSLNPPFDLIFIDGCHDFNYVKSDTNNAISCLSDKGIIIWHDYAMMDEVSRAVDGFSGTMNIMIVEGTRLAIGVHKSSKLFTSITN